MNFGRPWGGTLICRPYLPPRLSQTAKRAVPPVSLVVPSELYSRLLLDVLLVMTVTPSESTSPTPISVSVAAS